MAQKPEPKRGDSRRGPGVRSAKDRNKERKEAPGEKSTVPAWIDRCLEHIDPDLAEIYRTLPTDPAEMYAYMQKGLVAKGILMDQLYLTGELDLERAIAVQRECFMGAGQLLRLSRDALNTSEFDAVEGGLLPPGEHFVTYGDDGKANLRLVTTAEDA